MRTVSAGYPHCGGRTPCGHRCVCKARQRNRKPRPQRCNTQCC